MPPERRLAAIMFTDIVDYTALMAADEARGLAARERHRGVLQPIARRYGGEVVDENGDELVLSFPSAVDAVNCALAVQAVISREADLALRIGIHMGDVLFEDGRVYGDSVNLASRVRPFAEPGGVCISDEIEHAIHSHPNLEVVSRGTPDLKNVDRPIELYSVRGEAGPPSPRALPGAPRVVVAALAFGAVLAALGGWWIGSSRPPERGLIPGFAAPAIAVLPFDNLSDNSDHDLFAAGLVEDLTARLASWREFPVIARNSVFEVAARNEGAPLDVAAVGEELGARYVVEGSVRRDGDTLRVVVQLIDALSGSHVWAQTYDQKYESLLKVQDDISRSIASALVPRLAQFEGTQARHRDPESLDAWSNAQRGWWHFYRETREDNAMARAFFERAIEQEPIWTQPYAGVALTHYKDRAHLWTPFPDLSLDALILSAERAVALDPLDAAAHHALGHAYSMSGKTDRMIAAFARGTELNPSDAMANNCLGAHLGLIGEVDRAVEHLHRARALSPQDPRMVTFLFNLATAYFAVERYEDALEWAEKSLSQQPGADAYQIAVASLVPLGRIDEAQAALQELLRLRPDLSPAAIQQFYTVAEPGLAARLIKGLELAGWEPRETDGGASTPEGIGRPHRKRRQRNLRM
ncbi:MAG: tetratricopeptide repeat protein [Proteobacteria bacterium]|nr:tetratricopeptide repeat protein [Pseudomonadota bacterium]